MAEKLALVDNVLTCKICSDTFKDPVTLTCNHSFCCECLKNFWDQAKNKNCPTCKRKYSKEDIINFKLKELADSYVGRLKTESSEAVLSCEHPEEHQLFCEEEQRAVCRICDSSHHPGHKLVPIEQAVNKLKVQLKSDLRTLKDKMTKCESIKTTYNDEVVPHNKKQVEATEEHIRDEFEKFRQFLKEEDEARLAALKEEEEEKEKTVSREMKNIQGQMSSLSDSISAVEQELQKDNMSFLSSYKHTQTSARVQCTLSDPQLNSGALIDVTKHLGNLSFTVCEKMKERVKFTPVTLDPNTAAPWLCLSEDLTSVRWTDTKQQLPDNPERFTCHADVLGSEGFSSGKHSWEVEVGDHPAWNIGLAKESVDRKGETYASPEYGIWCLYQQDGVYKNVCGKTISLQMNPERIRVQLDYDRGEVSFYDPEDMTHIYTHKDTFTDKLYPYFSIGKAGDAETIDIKICQVETRLSGMLSGTDLWEVRGSDGNNKGTKTPTTTTAVKNCKQQ